MWKKKTWRKTPWVKLRPEFLLAIPRYKLVARIKILTGPVAQRVSLTFGYVELS